MEVIYIYVFQVSTRATGRNRCVNCMNNIKKDQLFCDECGYKLGSVCVGDINGNPCSKFISVKTKFCAHCGTPNSVNKSGNLSIYTDYCSLLSIV